VNIALVDREQYILGSIHGCGWEASGQVREDGAISKFRRREELGLEYCSGKLGRLVVAELLDADSW